MAFLDPDHAAPPEIFWFTCCGEEKQILSIGCLIRYQLTHAYRELSQLTSLYLSRERALSQVSVGVWLVPPRPVHFLVALARPGWYTRAVTNGPSLESQFVSGNLSYVEKGTLTSTPFRAFSRFSVPWRPPPLFNLKQRSPVQPANPQSRGVCPAITAGVLSSFIT